MAKIEVAIKDIDKQFNSAKITYTCKMSTANGEINFDNSVNLAKENDGNFKINWGSNLIFPNLNDTDKVKVSTATANRGKIIDRNGIDLATNRKSFFLSELFQESLEKKASKILKKLQNY